MKEISSYILYSTSFCFAINFILGKLKLLSLVWIYPSQKKSEPTIGISVIICSRNDLENLQHNLPSILQQEYPTFEVIVVDDASSDGTHEYLQSLSNENPNIKVVRIEHKEGAGKKHALKTGIEHATHSFVLLTDADCVPDSNQWIKSHAAYASPKGEAGLAKEKKSVVLGYGKFKRDKGFLNTFIRFDTAFIAINYMNRALWKYPYMGVGRNMGYSKELASACPTGSFRQGLNDVNASIASGDDDLFIQAIAKKSFFSVNLEKESFTTSIAKRSWKLWLAQKGRHTTTAPHYNALTKIWLIAQWMVSAGFYLGFITILLTGDIYIGLILLLLNALSIGLFNGLWLRKLGEKDLILLAPLLDIIYTFVQPIFVIKSWSRKKDEWN